MPREITDKPSLFTAIAQLDLISELLLEQNGKLKNATDLEVIAQGRDYGNGKKVGPYMRLLEFEGGESIMRQGEWGGNTFYISVTGELDVYVGETNGEQRKIGSIQPGSCFGEMAVLAGVERNATVTVPGDGRATVLELTRPSLRLLRKLPKFGQQLDETYRAHGFGRLLEHLGELGHGALDEKILAKLRNVARFSIYGKHHVLCQEGDEIDRIFLIKSGWLRRVRGVPLDASATGVAVGLGETIGADFLGAGNCLGLEGATETRSWSFSASLMSRSEVLEIPVAALSDEPELRDHLIAAFSSFSSVDDKAPAIELDQELRARAAAEEEIATGIVDAMNLLVMDMDLCMRCGNCSLACHKVHGQSRLLRRGIHIARPVGIDFKQTQHVLSPQVCMHCKDPECLTGCPTGAIFRDPLGQVDIDPATCIGCFDCATQCPYDAISMVPRNGKPIHQPGFLVRLKQRFSFSLAVPEEPTVSDDVVAIKCNLCENTPLNPSGARRKAYSCEENCPTGALVRVNPITYFTEVEQTQGLIFRDQTHAIGRNIHVSDPLSSMWRAVGLLLTVTAAVLTIWGLARNGFDAPLIGKWLNMRWLTGLVGLLSVAFVMTYPIRKQIYRRKAGALRYWMLAHVYIGALAGVVLMLHAGAHSGGLLTTSLLVTFYFVIATGIFGILAYIIGPRILTSIEGEPLLLEDLRGRRAELHEELDELAKSNEGWLRLEIDDKVKKRFFTAAFLWRQLIRREPLTAVLALAREEFKDRLQRVATKDERLSLIKAVENAVTIRRLDALILVHQALKIWVPPHVLATSLMLALMLVHIAQVSYFAVK